MMWILLGSYYVLMSNAPKQNAKCNITVCVVIDYTLFQLSSVTPIHSLAHLSTFFPSPWLQEDTV